MSVFGGRTTYTGDVSRSELNCAEQPQDDDNDVKEVGQDGSPLVSQEVYHLTLQYTDLKEETERTSNILFTGIYSCQTKGRGGKTVHILVV